MKGEVQQLQQRLLAKVNEEDYEEVLSGGVGRYKELLAQYVVMINNRSAEGSLIWRPSQDARKHDSIEVQGKIDVELLSDFIEWSDWLFELRRSCIDLLLEKHRSRALLEEQLRDQAIEEHTGEPAVGTHDGHGHDARDAKTGREENLAPKDKLLHKTKQLTNSLSRGTQLLQSGILQSDLNLDELKQQTSSLQKVDDKYQQLESIFTRTNQLVKTLEKASHQEKRDVYMALGFLCLCISWVVWRRILKLPFKLALWILFRFFKTILTTIGLVSTHMPSSPSTNSTTLESAASMAVSEAVDRLASGIASGLDDEL